MIRLALLVLSTLLFSQSSFAEKYKGQPTAKEIAYIGKEIAAVKVRLKDPKSATFSGVYVSRTAGVPVVCGYVNSKNSFGGFSGAQKFISASAADIVVTEEDMADGEMPDLWRKVC